MILNLNNDDNNVEMPRPPGQQKKIEDFVEGSSSDMKNFILNKAWQTAISPATGFFMYFIMFYFFGSSLNIYTLIMFCSVAINHLSNITGVNDRFKQFSPFKLS